MSEMQVGNLNVSSFPFLQDQPLISNLKSELNTWQQLKISILILMFFNGGREQIPQWLAVAQSILLVQPSSAASEHIFSLLSNLFSSQQACTLEDYIETSLMLQYNKRLSVYFNIILVSGRHTHNHF